MIIRKLFISTIFFQSQRYTIMHCSTYDHIIYLDNNATTPVLPHIKKIISDHLDCLNPSSSKGGTERNTIEDAYKELKKIINYHPIITSGASESNCTIIRSVIDSWYRRYGMDNKKTDKNSREEHKHQNFMPHVVSSSIEHHSTMMLLDQLEKDRRIILTYVNPDRNGEITDLDKYVTKNTCMCICMHANNETGTINDINILSKKCKQVNKKIFFHSDAVQTFGKLHFDVNKTYGPDSYSCSFHKLHGPKGIGVLYINPDKLEFLQGQITGTQQKSMRGGTENIAYIASIPSILKNAYHNRTSKNVSEYNKIANLLSVLNKKIRVCYRPSKDKVCPKGSVVIMVIGHILDKKTYMKRLPNTLYLSIILNPSIGTFCNVQLKKDLEKNNILVAISSACLTSQQSASHVPIAMGLKNEELFGLLRVSISDLTTQNDLTTFADKLVTNIYKQVSKPVFPKT